MTHTEYKSILKMLVDKLVSDVSYKYVDISGKRGNKKERIYELDNDLIYQAFLYITKDFDYNANMIICPQYVDNLHLPIVDKDLLGQCRDIMSLLVLYFNDNITTDIDTDDSTLQALPIGENMNKQTVYLYYDKPFMNEDNIVDNVIEKLLQDVNKNRNDY